MYNYCVMQRKKNDVKLKIKESATKLFFETKYIDVSMRDVAEKSQMTVGNIYRYYENKEILFDEIVKTSYEKTIKLIKISDFIQKFIKPRSRVNEKTLYKNTRFRKHLISTITNLMVENSTELYILLNNSEGSKYENITELITKMINDTLLKRMDIDLDNAEIYSFMIISTLSYILKKYIGDRDVLIQKIDVFFNKLFVSFL